MAGQYYLVKFDITAYTSDYLRVELGGNASAQYSATGTYMLVLQAGISTTYSGVIGFNSDVTNGFVGSIDNVEVYKIESVPSGERRVFMDAHYSYSGSGTLSNGLFALVGLGGIVYQEDVPAKGVYEAKFQRGFYTSTADDPLVAFLSAGSANVTGKLNVTMA